MFTYKVGLVDDGRGGLEPDLPPGTDFASAGEREGAVIIRTRVEVPGLAPLTEEQAEAEMTMMGLGPKALSQCWLGGGV